MSRNFGARQVTIRQCQAPLYHGRELLAEVVRELALDVRESELWRLVDSPSTSAVAASPDYSTWTLDGTLPRSRGVSHGIAFFADGERNIYDHAEQVSGS
jgi:hypothetical protein